MEKMKLYFGETIKEVFLKKIVTPKLRGEIAEIIVKFQENDNTKLITRTLEIIKKIDENVTTENVMTKFRDAVNEGKLNNEEIAEIIKLSKEVTNINPEIIKGNDIIKFGILKLIIDTKTLSDDEKNEIENNEFWLNQDLDEIDGAISFFRSKAKL
jgi:hypothetical protein